MKKRKPKQPIEMVLGRHRGGPQTTQKGSKGYDRKKEKMALRKEGLKSFFLLFKSIP